MRGDGGLYRRGGIWYARLWENGRRHRESLDTTDPELAAKRLAALRKKRDKGTYQDPTARRITIDELLDDVLLHLEVKGAAGVKKSKSTLKAVRDELGHLAARELDTTAIERAQARWLKQPRKPATVNRRLELLRQAYRLAARRTPPKVLAIPHIPLLKVSNARQGFLSPAQIDQLLAAVADPDLRDFIEWFAWTAMRPGEIRQLTWPMVDLHARTLNLDPRAAKIRKGRVLALEGPLWDVIARRLQARRLDTPLVFHRTSKGVPGSPVLDYRRAFAAAVKAARLPASLLPYDLRRSALRNMVRAKVDVTVAMKISGHRTRATFDRYNIVDEEDVREAILRTAAWAGRPVAPAAEANRPQNRPHTRKK